MQTNAFEYKLTKFNNLTTVLSGIANLISNEDTYSYVK